MGLSTDELNLYLTDMMTDGEDEFDFDRDLNENWKKIDKFAKDQRLNGIYFTKIKDITIRVPGQGVEDVEIDYYTTGQLE